MIGRTLGHYRIVEPLGAGGMGEVYRAHDEKLDRDVALKVLPEGALSDEEARKRFRREANALSRLSHPHIATIHDFDSEDGTDFIVMELVSGPSLADELKAGPLEQKRILTLGAQLARGLQAAHQQGIVHRDLKPSNLQLTPDGLLKILDFGLARLLPRETLAGEETAPTQTAVGKVAGTLAYMSPEQLRGRGVDARTDLYAAGAVLYEMATGRRLFAKPSAAELTDAILHEDPTPPRRLNSRISPGLESVILKALDKDPELRSQTAKDLLVDLERLTASSSSGAAPMAAASHGAARQRWAWWAVAAAVVAAFVVAAVSLLRSPAVPRVKSFTAIATGLGSAGYTQGHGLATDGNRVYFVDSPGHVLRQVASTGGDPQEIPLPFGADPLDYSARLSALLLRDGTGGLWALTIPGNKPRRLGDFEVGTTGSAAWSPEGDRLAFIKGSGLYLATADGLEPKPLVDLGTRLQGLVWSPDGRHLRLGAVQGAEWWIVEVDTEDPNRPPVHIALGGGNSGWPPGTWTRDGRYFVFAPFTSVSGLHSRLLVRPEGPSWPWASREPVEVLPAPDLWVHPTASPLDDRVFIVNSRPRGALRRFDRSEGRWVPGFSDLGPVEHLDFTADGEWVVGVTYPEGALWRARVDGTERLGLSRPAESTRVFKPRWSPDGRRIAFERSKGGGPHKPFVVLAEGGSPPEPVPSGESEGVSDICWLPDGRSVVFGHTNPAAGIQKVDLDTGALTSIPGSEGLTHPRCGPGGVILAAEGVGSGSTRIFDPEAGLWSQLPVAPDDLAWAEFASDGRSVLGLGGASDVIQALDLETNELSVAARIEGGLPTGYFGMWFGLAPDDSPLYLADVGGWDLYALELEMP